MQPIRSSKGDRVPSPDARAMYRHVLEGWVQDALRLRRTGLDRPCARRATLAPSCPRAA